MEQNSSWEAVSHSASQQILRLLWKQKIYFRVQNIPPPVPTSATIQLVHTFLPYVPEIHSNII
jgi:hypothetical protein